MTNLPKKKSNEKIFQFLGESIIKYSNQKIVFLPQKKIKVFDSEATGWATEKEIRIATKMPLEEWFPIYVHETCHVDQSIERKEWHAKLENCVGRLDRWLEGKPVKGINSSIDGVIELEWDCECRTVKKIKKYNLPVDIDDYIQKANAYIIGYNWTRVNRKWCKHSYTKESVWNSMPKKLVSLSTALNPTPKIMAPYYD